MQKYETAILFEPELPEERRKEFIAKLAGVISSFKGEVVKQDDWGIRKLAYHIAKKPNAYYTFLVYSGNRGVVEEVERNIKIFDGILRHLTSRVDVELKPAAAAPAAPGATAAPEGGPAAPVPPAAEQAPPAQ
ncbi:MAG: 30S ribosomal protein S6 [Deltaproteobacteria bacterium]